MMAGKQRYTTAQVIEALRQTRGIQSRAAEALGCSRGTVANYIARYPTVAAVCQELRETIVDTAEAKLLKLIDDEQWPAVRFALATLGKGRGWVERQELTGADGGPVVTERVVTVREYLDDGTTGD